MPTIQNESQKVGKGTYNALEQALSSRIHISICTFFIQNEYVDAGESN